MAFTMRPLKSQYIGYWFLGACALFPNHAAGQSYQSQAPVIKQLTIAAWSVPVSSQTTTTQQQATGQSGWRNTFGRERKTAQWRKLGTRSVDADIVVPKNLKSLRDIRRIFPARTHQVIASRAALANLNRLTESSTRQLEKKQSITYPSFPAAAIRRRRGLRVTTVRHLSVKINETENKQNQQANLYAGLATRIWVSGPIIWLLTPVDQATCKTTSCDPVKVGKQKIEQWLKQQGEDNYAILLATATLSPDQPDKDPKPVQNSDSASQVQRNCAHTTRPNIEAAKQFRDREIKFGPKKVSADQPCATITTLYFGD